MNTKSIRENCVAHALAGSFLTAGEQYVVVEIYVALIGAAAPYTAKALAVARHGSNQGSHRLPSGAYRDDYCDAGCREYVGVRHSVQPAKANQLAAVANALLTLGDRLAEAGVTHRELRQAMAQAKGEAFAWVEEHYSESNDE